MLLFNKKLSAKEAFEYGLLTEVVGEQSFEAKTKERLEIVSKLPREVFQFDFQQKKKM